MVNKILTVILALIMAAGFRVLAAPEEVPGSSIESNIPEGDEQRAVSLKYGGGEAPTPARTGSQGTARISMARNTTLWLTVEQAIPADKIMVVTIEPEGTANAFDFLSVIHLAPANDCTTLQYPQGGWYPRTRMSYFPITAEDKYMIYLRVPGAEELSALLKEQMKGMEPDESRAAVTQRLAAFNAAFSGKTTISFKVHVYIADYLPDGTFARHDAAENRQIVQEDTAHLNNYLIFNAPEALNSIDHLADSLRYIGKMPVNGNANIYWEHFNEYIREMYYGVLLYNPTKKPVSFTINRKASYASDEEQDYRAMRLIWNEYFYKRVMPDKTDITSSNNTFTLMPGDSKWISLKSVTGVYNQNIVIFNGIINLNVELGKTLDCYAFMMNPGTASSVKWDFDNGHCENYSKAAGGEGGLTGTTNAPIVVKELDFADKTEDIYTLLLTGMDMPEINSGEALALHYNKRAVMNNAQNYSTIYRLDISNFEGERIVFEYNPYAAPDFIPNTYSAIYVGCEIQQYGQQRYSRTRTLLHPTGYPSFDTELEVDLADIAYFNRTDSFSVYMVVSGMSSLPITVRFE